jgi:acetyl esterase/lipase
MKKLLVVLSLACPITVSMLLRQPESVAHAQEADAATATLSRSNDIIYSKQDGFALTLDKVAPADSRNGAAIVMVMSGGWFSNHDMTKPHDERQLPNFAKQQAEELLARGYTLFYVVHGTQPKFTIREIVEQISEAVQFIRRHADEYEIDPGRIGIMGASAGGHLSLMQGTRGEDAEGDAESDRVQAVVAYFPPTDFVNYGNKGVFFDKVVREVLPGGKNPFLAALELREFDQESMLMIKVKDEQRLAEHYQEIAPLYHVTADDAPALILHGDADRLVPLQQAELIVQKLKAAGVPNELYVKEGGDHGWPASEEEALMIADWFDKHL